MSMKENYQKTNYKKKNYQKELDYILESLSESKEKILEDKNIFENKNFSKRPTLLLHACCAPCSSYVLEYLSKYFLITVYYYNPNIHPKEEYERRFLELEKFLLNFPSAIENGVKFISAEYKPKEFDEALRVDEDASLALEKERGERCSRCYTLRMKKAYEYASQNGYDWFTTTLSISPFKDADKINEIGKQLEKSAYERIALLKDKTKTLQVSENLLCKKHITKFLTSDFKKKGGFKRSLELSAQFELYRQKYCGCKYSLANCYTRKGERWQAH